MCRLCLRNFIARFRLASVDDIGKLYRILDEEHRNIVANDIPVTLSRVELDCKASNISNSVCTAAATKNRGESDKHRRLSTLVG